MSIYLEIEAICKQHIKQLEKRVNALKESDITDKFDIESYIKRQELKSYINNYRLALKSIEKYGKGYVGHQAKEWWLSDLDELERVVFLMRFRQKKNFEEIKRTVKVADVPKIYEQAYRKVDSNNSFSTNLKGGI